MWKAHKHFKDSPTCKTTLTPGLLKIHLCSHTQAANLAVKRRGPLWTAALEAKTITRLNFLRLFFHMYLHSCGVKCGDVGCLARVCVSVSFLARLGGWTAYKRSRTAECQRRTTVDLISARGGAVRHSIWCSWVGLIETDKQGGKKRRVSLPGCWHSAIQCGGSRAC